MLIRTWLFDDVAVVEASGRLCIESASSLGDAVREAIRMRGRRLVLNLVDVSRVDAAGLGELAGAFRIVRAAAGDMKVVAVPDLRNRSRRACQLRRECALPIDVIARVTIGIATAGAEKKRR